MSKRLPMDGPSPGWPSVHKKFHSFFVLLFTFLVISATCLAQVRTITGTVTNEKREPVSNVSVFVKGTNTGTTTNDEGKFSIQLPAGKNVLVLTSIGYKSREVTAGSQASLDVQLEMNVSEGETVVVAYGGTQKKATLSGSIASVKGEEILKSPAIDVSNSLAGRVPGLTVVAQGGEPGNDFSTILVRGINTFRDATPLFVIDGVPLQGSDNCNALIPLQSKASLF